MPDVEIGGVATSERPPRCHLCNEAFDYDNEDEVILIVRPALLEQSSKSGRLRLVEMEFNLQGTDYDNDDHLLWHYLCLAAALHDPSVIGHKHDY